MNRYVWVDPNIKYANIKYTFESGFWTHDLTIKLPLRLDEEPEGTYWSRVVKELKCKKIKFYDPFKKSQLSSKEEKEFVQFPQMKSVIVIK